MVVEEIPILKDIIADNQKLIDDMTDKLIAIKNDLVEWSRHHDPPEQEEQIHLWCSMNRLIGDHFGTDWMDNEPQSLATTVRKQDG